MSERRLVLRRKEITIKEGDYAGWKFTGIVNPPLNAIEDLTSATIERMKKGLTRIIVAPWNFVDEEGKPMPDPSLDTIGELPIDLVSAISTAYIAETATLPSQ